MGTITLSDIELTPLKRVETVGGDVLHGIKSSDKSYAGFGEAYFCLLYTSDAADE